MVHLQGKCCRDSSTAGKAIEDLKQQVASLQAKLFVLQAGEYNTSIVNHNAYLIQSLTSAVYTIIYL